jgi:hypothetical protein
MVQALQYLGGEEGLLWVMTSQQNVCDVMDSSNRKRKREKEKRSAT